jgi:large repetitive protein
VHVLGAASTHLVPPTAEPDVAQAVVGQPLTLHPLANDLPGADPTAPQAQLTIAGPVGAPSGATVTTDISAGTVTFTAQRPGPFLLGYNAAFGAAPTSHGDIRIQVSPASGSPKPPVAVPDVAVIHGQQPAVVDVIANDYDPQGWVLGVVGARSTDPAIHVTVVAQRWLRITSDDPKSHIGSTVSYTVGDGYRTATGTVSVAVVPAGADQITAHDDSIVIRAGDSAAVPVLANDLSSTALPLGLDEIAPTATPAVHGLLASNQGADVRVTAPASARTEQETTVNYVATDVSGATATGHLHVTIKPLPSAAHPNQAPSPENVATRETAGDIVVVHIPTYGIDPDGDSTAVTAIATPPSLGRIVSIGPSTIAYQSYPTSVGTDTFSYQVTDPYGATGTAQVQVGILPPSLPQPPIAVDETVNAPPGAALHLDLLANAYVAPGDHATVVPLSRTNSTLPPGVRLIGSFIYLRAPARATDAPLDISYGITDGSSAPSLGHVIVRAVAGAKLLPIARDDVAPALRPGDHTVTVDVLANDDDPAGSRGDLKISAVPRDVTIHGASLTIPVATWPREVPYQITAPDGLTATAVVDVPGTATSAITLKRGARITVKPHGTVTVPLSSVLTDAYGRPVRITTLDHLAASPPGDISVDAHQSTAVVVHALGRYTGPGAVTVQVYDGTSLQDPHGHTAIVTIPVQVGPDVPLLRCPQGALPVNEGGSPQTFDIGLLCDVWVDTTITAPPPHYTVSWARPAAGVSASVVDGTGLRLAAGASAHPGAAGRLRITPVGAATGGEVGVTVVAAPLPTGRPVTISGVQAGHRVTVDLAQYVSSPLAQPHIQVLRVTHPGDATVSSSGATVAITPASSAHGTVTVVASVSDVPGRADRGISVVITAQILGRPGPPGQPSATASNHSITVSFAPAAANGAPIDHYTVFANRAPHVCAASPCTVTGLQNNVTYDIYVTAHNSVGDGAQSGHTKAMPNQVPDQVVGLKTSPGDAQILLSWQPAVVDGSPVTKYLAEISPAPPAGPSIRTLGGSVTATTFTGLVNGTTYSFRVDAINAKGPGPWSASVTDIPFGKPITMPAPTASAAAVPNPQATRAVTVSWAAANANGRPVTGYTVREYQSSASGGPWALDNTITVSASAAEQSFNVANNGSWYAYTVTATNQAGESAESPKSAAVQGAAPPDAPSNLSAADHDSGSATGYNGAVHVDFTVPNPNSAGLSYIQYGLNGPTASGRWDSPPAVGSTADESITGLANGTAYTVYVSACNDAGLCGPWAGPSNQVIPYGPPGQPSVSAHASGTSISYSWGGGGGNGRNVSSYHVCFDGGSCVDTGAGSTSKSYGYSQTHTITAYVVDAAGQQSATASASATTVAAPAMSVSVSQGPGRTVSGCGSTPPCYGVNVTVSNAPSNTVLHYACYDTSDSPPQFWPTSGTVDTDWNNRLVQTNGSGAASWQSQCVFGYWGRQHLQVSVNGTYSP